MQDVTKLIYSNLELQGKNDALQSAYLELQTQQKLLEKSWHDSVYAQLTRTIAHELKNPLFEFGMVIGALRSAIDEDRETAIIFIDSLAKTIEELLELVHTMLETGGASVGEIKEMNVSEVMRRVLLLSEGSLKKNQIHLYKEIEEVPSIVGDSKCFLMIFSNLIVNAIEAMTIQDHPSGVPEENLELNQKPKTQSSYSREARDKFLNVRIKKDIAPLPHRNGIIIEIEDSGVGIAKSKQMTLFQGGQSTKNISERQRGIGLNLVWKLIHQMGGDITVHSDPELKPGTLFRIAI